MNNSDEDKKQYEERLQRRLQILRDQLEKGHVHFNEGMQVIESLKAVRYAADGTVDLNSVDGLVRSLALAIEGHHNREELKKTASVHDIQNAYFKVLTDNFAHFFNEMVRLNLTPHDAGIAISRGQSSREEFAKSLPPFLEFIDEFWNEAGDIVHVHIEDMRDSLKCVYGGDLFPAHDENLASKCGIYTDTIILPEPFLRSRLLFGQWDEETRVRYFVKHALNLLQYKELACADLNPPIVIVAPDYTALQHDEMNFMLELGKEDAVIHATKLFGRTFSDIEEVMDYADGLTDIESLLAKVHDPARILFDTDWPRAPKEQILRAQNDQHAELLRTTHPGRIVAAQAIGRMATANELLIKARRFGGSPIIDAPTSWQYFVWKLEYDAQRMAGREPDEDLHLLRALQSLSQTDMPWLGRVPPDALIEILKIDALPEIRAILTNGVSQIASANPENFHRTTDKVFDNIEAAFAEHRQKIKELSGKKWRFAGKDIGAWFAVGSVELAAAATGSPAWGIAALAANQLFEMPKLKDIPESIKKLADENRKLTQSPVGLLFKYGNKK